MSVSDGRISATESEAARREQSTILDKVDVRGIDLYLLLEKIEQMCYNTSMLNQGLQTSIKTKKSYYRKAIFMSENLTSLERKKLVLTNGDYDTYRDYRRAQHDYSTDLSNNTFSSKSEADAFAEWKRENDFDNWHECEKLDNARWHRIKRLKTRMNESIKRGCYFCTLTFTDDVLAKTKPSTRHYYVKTWLRQFVNGIANIDFGAENGREHYHAVVTSKKALVDMPEWKYGYKKYVPVKHKSDVDIDSQAIKLAGYSSKLVNHAIKDTTKGYRTIYSGKWLSDVSDNVGAWCDDSLTYVKREKYSRKVDSDNGIVKSECSQMSFIRISDDLKFVLDD